MRRPAVFLPCLVALGVLCGAPAGSAPVRKEQLIYRIDGVSAMLDHRRIVIRARGAVKSGGWAEPRLVVHAGPAGQHAFLVEFVAVPPAPDSAVIQALLPITASVAARIPRGGVTAVRVVSQTNEITTQVLH